ncbi:hypothetical protein P879_02476 [Paragonimus westermani]|uniref:Uncharacterized protein n=2 Tax=Paragonimus westermani TaxID=34504 RepID=A0A8T0DMK5_9TREM|nr:uncharacterized protein DEA37_0001711 [Paragonimus westermani]KAF8567951.1 hypothetical protein P879_02476 [Paragonimus westermani]
MYCVQLITEQQWDELFPERWGVGELWKREYRQLPFYQRDIEVDYYSHENFIRALHRMDALYCNKLLARPGLTTTERLRARAALLALMSQETCNGDHALYYREELTHERYEGGPIELYRDVGDRTNYRCSSRPVFHSKCAYRPGEVRFPVQSYHGRGPGQLTGAADYGMLSEFVFGNPDKLLQNPDILLEDGVLGFMSVIWIWMTKILSKHCPHRAMYWDLSSDFSWGFGNTIMAMNKYVKTCTDYRHDHDAVDQEVVQRMYFYRKYACYFGVPVGT